ncbi:FtsK/SpoIIIE domain-containing protein [Cellulomonas oligotrophica]|uniref:S-DNA-T family DNA segregation ATPase FtsK/SpoIIIE n=1 Tax=Cellulomonas oligotrophica TaxID=931536 RepID=A0A7Y9K0J6_9CELL|nr:FtsK/SpoIIIE domain-containing protein [Cellulomonas oligotrophica]NYD87964.1 S-DNA-T family DNA segregation ATPase FtsK/SpoIIIE [Cellulomonas oligotrophica]
MRTRLTVLRGSSALDVVVGTDAAASVGDVATALVRSDAVPATPTPTLQVIGSDGARGALLRPDTPLPDSGVRSGSTVTVTDGAARFVTAGTGAPALVRLQAVAGPATGLVVDLPAGVWTVGRGSGADVRLADLQVSNRHARFVVSDRVTVADTGSLNGVLVDGGRVDRAPLSPGQDVVLGESVLRFDWLVDPATVAAGGVTRFNRSPRVVPRYPEREVQAPAPPEPPAPGRFPWVAMVAPAAMGLALYAVTRSVLSLVFVGLAPLLAAGTWLDKKLRDRQQLKDATTRFRTALQDLTDDVTAAHELEQRQRREEEPDTWTALRAALDATPVLWSRRRTDDTFATVHLGLGADTSRTRIVLPPRGRALPEVWADLQSTVSGLADVSDVPHLVSIPQAGAFGVAGVDRDAVMRAVLAQLVALHSPADLQVAAFASRRTARTWDWLKWLPHVSSAHLASGPAPARVLLTRLEELVAERLTTRASRFPVLVVLVENDTPAERGRLVRLAEDGPAAGIHVLWSGDRVSDLPAACTRFVDLDAGPDGPRVGSTAERSWRAANPPRLDDAAVASLSRHLASFVDAGAPTLDESDVPRQVTWLQVAGHDLADQPAAVIDRWNQTGSLIDRDAARTRRTTDATLRAVVGAGADGDFVLDLREQGPHALVGGTTGSGKSEFLQSWVLAMAATHSPDRVTFLLVDYKGGAAFADCVHLPHCVGLVTDLTPHLVRRALTSLRAELRRREKLLAAKGAKDLLTLERTGDPDTPPALVIVVDEFAALVSDVPEFVDGMIDVAQRGRSLGLHLILATQRPAGVIRDNLRANTNLRVALRVADEHDSTDVLGTDVAAAFDPAIPGRGAVRTGPDRVAIFQAAYAGGHTPPTPPRPTVELATLDFGPGTPLDVPGDASTSNGPSDISRVVATIRVAAESAGVRPPARPWLPELAPTYDLQDLPAAPAVAFGVVDVPEEQAQHAVSWDPDTHGSLVVHGTSGSGKSTTLRTLAVATPGPVHVYGIDASSGGLDMLTPLPRVGSIIDADDHERVARLVRLLHETLDERAAAFAAAHASTLTDHRAKTGQDLPRILLLIDGLGALRDAYETDLTHQHLWSGIGRVVTEGRPLGVHLAATAERPSAIPTTWGPSLGYRLVLRQTDEAAYLQMDVPRDALTPTSPPGRAVVAGTTSELQVAVPAGSTDPAAQARALSRTVPADETPAPAIGRLPTVLTTSEIPSTLAGKPVLGLAGDTLTPITFDPSGAFLVAGSPGSGRSTTLTWLAQAVTAALPGARAVYLGSRRSPAALDTIWESTATNEADATDLARDLAQTAAHDPDGTPLVLVIEALGEWIGTTAETPLLSLIKSARRNGHLVIAEGETPTWASGWPLIAEVRNTRRGLVLAPETHDGDTLFRVPFPRASRATYPPGRGVWVEAGRTRLVQIPHPARRTPGA